MSRTLTVNAVDRTSVWRQIVEKSSAWAFREEGYGGAVGSGSCLLDDVGAAYTVPGMKGVSLDESSASSVRVFTGYTDTRWINRGPFGAGTDRQWRVELVDANALFDDQILINSDSANRPAETDYERVTWLIGTGALGSVSAGTTVPSGSNVNMDAVDYRGQHPRDVMNDCSQKSGKNYFIYRSSALFLFYALASGSTFTSTLKISDDPADVDGSTTFAPIIEADSLKRDPLKVFSGVRLRYKGGSVYVRNATTASNFRTHEAAVTNMKIKTAAKATEQAQKWLDNSAAETDSLPTISIVVPAANVNDIRAGQRMQLKLRHADITAFTYFRVRAREVRPNDDISYRITLEFLDDVRVTSYVYTPNVPEEQSNGTDDPATVIIDENGITITGGAISVTNGGGVVIIDGTSDMFRIAATGTLGVGPNPKVGQTLYTSVRVNTGLSYDPLTTWSFQPKAYSNGDWKQSMPYYDIAKSGLVLNGYFGRARVINGTKTDVQGALFTSRPTSPRVTYRYYILEESAI